MRSSFVMMMGAAAFFMNACGDLREDAAVSNATGATTPYPPVIFSMVCPKPLAPQRQVYRIYYEREGVDTISQCTYQTPIVLPVCSIMVIEATVDSVNVFQTYEITEVSHSLQVRLNPTDGIPSYDHRIVYALKFLPAKKPAEPVEPVEPQEKSCQ